MHEMAEKLTSDGQNEISAVAIPAHMPSPASGPEFQSDAHRDADTLARQIDMLLDAAPADVAESALETVCAGRKRKPGQRRAETVAARDRRDALLRQCANQFCMGMSRRQAAMRIAERLRRYNASTWSSEKALAECPSHHDGKITAHLWRILKIKEHVLTQSQIEKRLR